MLNHSHSREGHSASDFLVLTHVCCTYGTLRLQNGWHVQVELPPSDLSATGLLNKSLQLLQEILSSQDSSNATPEDRKQAIAQVTIARRFYTDGLFIIYYLKILIFMKMQPSVL